MKKQKKQEKKAAIFSIKPFTALKGFHGEKKTVETVGKDNIPQSTPGAEEDGEAMFRRAVADVMPLQGVTAPKARERKEDSHARVQEAEDRGVFLQEIEKLRIDVKFQDELPPDVKPLHRLGSSRLRDLKRGAIRIGLELDLHGLTRTEALASLERFIGGAYNRNQGAVLVITGRGNNSSGEPVLQMAVQGWLREKGKSMVAEFTPAPRQLGGNGAFVVFLRERDRER